MCSTVSSEYPAPPSRTCRGRAKPACLRWRCACAVRISSQRLPWGRSLFSSVLSGRLHGGSRTALPACPREEDAPRPLSEVTPVSHCLRPLPAGVCVDLTELGPRPAGQEGTGVLACQLRLFSPAGSG